MLHQGLLKSHCSKKIGLLSPELTILDSGWNRVQWLLYPQISNKYVAMELEKKMQSKDLN